MTTEDKVTVGLKVIVQSRGRGSMPNRAIHGFSAKSTAAHKNFAGREILPVGDACALPREHRLTVIG
jgi:hypothetical protein